MMKTIVVITAILLYENVPMTMQTDWPGKDFNSVYECREYIKWNRVNLTIGLFDKHLQDENGNQLISYNYFCETRSFTDLQR